MDSESESALLIEEIASLGRERRDLLHSLTPSLSHWEQIHGEGKFQATRMRRGRENMTSASQYDSPQELANYLDFVVEDVEDLGHRMLSMAYGLDQSGASVSSSYKAKEVVSRTSRLNCISEEFYNDAKNNNNYYKEEEEQEGKGDDFLFLCRNYLQFPDSYKNELALNFDEDEDDDDEEEEKEKEKEEEEEGEEDVSTMEFLKSMMDFRKEGFEIHRAYWERVWGSETGRCGAFEDTTTLSSMHFTHYTPDTIPSSAIVTGSTLEIYSIKIIKLSGNLNWPLKVYGLVAARDTVDRNRNILFSRSKRNYQLLTEKDPFLRLTGPSRAILAVDPADFEVELKIDEGSESRDRASISLHKSYHAKGSTSLFPQPQLYSGVKCRTACYTPPGHYRRCSRC
ncbi:hypothetical protein ACQ4PT_066677 [Festuca glaucescens]